MAPCWRSGAGVEMALGPDDGAPRALVIGIGNPLRGDDGVGWALVEDLEASLPDPGPCLELRVVHQLTPELAVELAEAQRVLFIDAWVPLATSGEEGDGSGLRPWLRELWPARQHPGSTPPYPHAPGAMMAPMATGRSHHLDPGALLAMTAALFDGAPCAHLLQVPAFAFGFGMDFSPALRSRLPMARALLRRWLRAGAGQTGAAVAMEHLPGHAMGRPHRDPVGHA